MSFFTAEEIPANQKILKPTCSKCGLSRSAISPKIDWKGRGDKKILLLNRAPNEGDDKYQTHFSGNEGDFIKLKLKKYGVNYKTDCFRHHAVQCFAKTKPTSLQIEACRDKAREIFDQNDIDLILAFDDTALEALIGDVWTKDMGSIQKWRGHVIPERSMKCWVAPMYHPKYVVNNIKKSPVLEKIFESDLEHALGYLDKPFPDWDDEAKCIKFLWTEESQVDWMSKVHEHSLNEETLMAFDYETTGLKAQAKGHKIACVSMSVHEREAVVMPFPLGPKSARWFKRLLTSKNIQKTAHNMKYEDTWTTIILGYDVYPWAWCSMQATHVIDNRPGITSLKFQGYVHFGLPTYDESIRPYLIGIEEKNANSMNAVMQAPKSELLLYCGIDSLVQYRLAIKQMRECEYDPYNT